MSQNISIATYRSQIVIGEKRKEKKIKFNMEEWKEMIGYNGRYFISNRGQIKAIFQYSGKRKDRQQGTRETLMTPQKDKNGYLTCNLSTGNGIFKTKRIHKEVFRNFISTDFSSKDQICHKDGKINNNWSTNLYKGNQITNTLDKYRHGTTKITIEQVKEIRELGKTMLQADLAKRYGVKQPYISRILSGIRCPFI
jgi:hypothetical protein